MASKLTLEIVHHAWPRLHEALWSLFKIYRSIWIEACSEHYKKQTERGVQFVSYSLHCSSSSSIVFGKCRNSSQCLIPNLSRTSNEGGGSIRWKWKKIRTVTVDLFPSDAMEIPPLVIQFHSTILYLLLIWVDLFVELFDGLVDCIMVTGVLAAVVRVGGVEDSLVVNASSRQWGPSSLHPPLSRQSGDLIESACCLCVSRLQVVTHCFLNNKCEWEMYNRWNIATLFPKGCLPQRWEWNRPSLICQTNIFSKSVDDNAGTAGSSGEIKKRAPYTRGGFWKKKLI